MTATPVNVPAIPPGGAIRVLIAEDEAHLGTILEQFLTARGFNVRVVRNGREALDLLVHETFDVALLDVVMPEIDGLEVLRMVREQPMPPEVIVITGNGTIETAMAALRLGAYDFLSKPYRMAEIDALVRRAWEKRILVRDNRHLRARVHRERTEPLFLTQFAPLVAVMNMAAKFAGSPLPVLITGEVGTGKHTVARLLHAHGERRGTFVRMDCRTVPADRHMAELFGVSSPTPIGSDDDTEPVVGALELASAGTLFLDRVDCLARDAQLALLAALDAGEFVPKGDARRRTLDVRVVASSTRDLAPLVASGAFSEALLHRLVAMRVTLPPLRERTADVPLLAEHFLQRAATSSIALTTDAVDLLERHSWPGNVAELRLVMERAALVARDGIVSASSLLLSAPTAAPHAPVSVSKPAPAAAAPATVSSATAGPPAAGSATAASLGDLERRHISEVLDRTNWHQGRAAELLGISPKTLYRKIREYGFKRPSGRNS